MQIGKQSILCYVAIAWFVMVVLGSVGADLFAANHLSKSDFYMNFYTAARILLSGHPELLYPSTDTYANGSFDLFMHKLFPALGPEIAGTFPYCPLVACMFVPLGLLLPNIALLIWQCLNVLGLAAYAYLAAKFDRAKLFQFLSIMFLFFPVAVNVWLGQSSIGFGLLPLAFGYYLLRRERDVWAGTVWSLLFLKPQFLPIALVTSIGAGRYKTLTALIVGTAVLAGGSVVCLSPEVFLKWIHTLKLAEGLFSGSIVVSPGVVACLPGVILALPPETRAAIHTWVYLALGAVAVSALAFVIKKLRGKFERDCLLDAVLIVNIYTLPFYSRLLLYDLPVFVLAASLVFLRPWSAVSSLWQGRMRKLIIYSWAAIDLRILFVTFGWHVPGIAPEASLPLFACVIAAITVSCWWIFSSAKASEPAG